MATRKAVTNPGAAAANGDSELKALLESLRSELAVLSARVAKLESPVAAVVEPVAAAAVAEAAAPVVQEDELPEEILLAISAAVAAFLGKRAPIRQIRLLSSGAWAQQGRAFIQASHRIEVHHGAHHHHH